MEPFAYLPPESPDYLPFDAFHTYLETTPSVRKRASSESLDEQDDAMTVNLVGDGDLEIHVSCSSERKKRLRGSDVPLVYQQTFVVSSAVMRIASPVWKTMFDPQGHFMDSQRSFTHGVMDLPEDNADALLCVLRIAHLQFRRVPERLDYAGLLNLAIICDKYDTVAIVRPVSDSLIRDSVYLHFDIVMRHAWKNCSRSTHMKCYATPRCTPRL